jgi:hypothetical protein
MLTKASKKGMALKLFPTTRGEFLLGRRFDYCTFWENTKWIDGLAEGSAGRDGPVHLEVNVGQLVGSSKHHRGDGVNQ